MRFEAFPFAVEEDEAMARMSQVMGSFVREDRAHDNAGVCSVVALIAIVCVGAVTLLGGSVNGRFQALAADLLAA